LVQDKLHEVWSIEIILLQTSLGELVLERKEKGLIHGFYPLHFPIRWFLSIAFSHWFDREK